MVLPICVLIAAYKATIYSVKLSTAVVVVSAIFLVAMMKIPVMTNPVTARGQYKNRRSGVLCLCVAPRERRDIGNHRSCGTGVGGVPAAVENLPRVSCWLSCFRRPCWRG